MYMYMSFRSHTDMNQICSSGFEAVDFCLRSWRTEKTVAYLQQKDITEAESEEEKR